MAIEVFVRRASLADLPGIITLNDGLFMEDAAPRDPHANLEWVFEYGEIYFASALEDLRYCVFLAEAAGQPIGYLIGSLLEEDPLRPIRVVQLESMFVVGKYRGQGIGTNLVQMLREWASEHMADRLQVTAYASNARAIVFYRRQGFNAWKLTLEAENTLGV